MKQAILILLFLLTSILFAQEWSEPVNISNMAGHDISPDITIDNNGVLHCVWEHEIETNFRKIFYSKSDDNGETWSPPENISQNNEYWLGSAQIDCDLQNNLFVTYDYNIGDWSETAVYLQKYNGINWNDPLNLTEGYPGCNHSKIAIDSENRVYIFFYWFSFRYRYLENGEWSDVLYPYPNPGDDEIGFSDIVVDSNDNLHLTGKYINNTTDFNHTIYANYNKENNEWSELVFIHNEFESGGEGIALDNEENPHIVTRCSVAPYPYNTDRTQYSYYDGENWIDPLLVVEDPREQVIQNINNDVYIIDREKNEDIYNAVIYVQSNNFEGEIIYTADIVSGFLLRYSHDTNILYFFFTIYNSQEEDTDVFLMKKEIDTNITEENIIHNLSYDNITLSQNYPNPFNPQTNINFSLRKGGKTTLKIFNIKGQLIKILVNEYKQKGDHSVIWNGTDMQNRQVSSGAYYYRLQVGNRVKTKSLTLVK